MFKITPNPTFKTKTPLSIPGQAQPVSIEVEFRHLTRTQMQEFFGGLQGKTDADALAEIIVGWGGVDAPFDRETLGMLLDNYPAAAAELFDAFRKQALEARAKN